MKFVRSAFVVGAVVSVFAVPAGASAAPTWASARTAVLPSGATGLPQGYLPALACASVGDCVAGGDYTNTKSQAEGLLLNEVNGAWRSPLTITPPSNAAANASTNVFSVACGAVGYCSAVGSYQDKSGNALPFTVSEVAGTWRDALEATLPANAIASGQNAQLRSIDCARANYCTAVGTYDAKFTPLAQTEGLVLDEVAGTWRPGAEVHLPGGTNANPLVALNQVACASAGNCSAVGQYTDANGATHGLVVSERASRWSSGLSLVLPGNASAYPDASLSSVACAPNATCTAIGSYANATGDLEGLATSESNGTFARASAFVMPSGASSNPHVFLYGYGGISCPSSGNCSAGGQYTDTSDKYQGFLIDEVNGTWQTAAELKLPSGAQEAGKNGGVVALSCVSPGNCSAGAAYLDASGEYQALVVNRISGTWQTGTKVALPSGATSVGVAGGVYGLICKRANECTATGSYLKNATVYEGFTLGTS
ncbi:MAG: hypothetical protein ABSC34_00440 [Acidimicrobiales bacterium]|jgi:hypothetical protein